MPKNINSIKYLTSYNYDKLLLLNPNHFVSVKCELPNFLKKGAFKSAYLVGSQALILFSKQYKFIHGLKKNTANDYDILFPFESVEHTYVTLTEKLNLKDTQIKDIKNNKRVFKCSVWDGARINQIDYIFMYRKPEEIFLSFDFNFLCLYVDIGKEVFILSTQFLEYVEKRIPILKNVYYEYRTLERINKYLYENTEYVHILENVEKGGSLIYEFKTSDNQAIFKFQNVVYKVIIFSRIFKIILTLRKYKTVVIQLAEICWCPDQIPITSKPVVKIIHGCEYINLVREKYREKYDFVLQNITDLFSASDCNDTDIILKPSLKIIYGLKNRELQYENQQYNNLIRAKYREIYNSVLHDIQDLFIAHNEEDIDFKLNPALKIICGLRNRELQLVENQYFENIRKRKITINSDQILKYSGKHIKWIIIKKQ